MGRDSTRRRITTDTIQRFNRALSLQCATPARHRGSPATRRPKEASMRLLKALLIAVPLSLASATPAFAAEAVKTVYHLNDGRPQAQRALGNIRNHLDADPSARITVVTHGAGVDFLLDGAETADGTPFAGTVDELAQRGVKFMVCNNTLTQRKIARERLSSRAQVVPSGVAEVARLQAQEGYTYLRP
jgi:uncharacterized protein